MSVIVASPAYPRPPLDGDKVRWSSLLPQLAKLEPLDGVFGFMPALGEIRDPTFDMAFASLAIVPTANYEVTARAGLLALRGQPSAFGRRATPRWQRAVAAAATQHPQAPLLLLGTSGGFIPAGLRGTLLDLIDVRSRVRTTSADRLTSGRMLAAELALVERHHIALACEADRQWLVSHGANAARIHLVPHGVGPQFFEGAPPADSRTIVFVGSLQYAPNRQAIDWFLKNCWPSLRNVDATLRIVGYGAERIAAGSGIEVFANVSDVGPHYRAAALTIAPLLEARGTQFKVLESMASGVPVVGTSPVAGGLFADHPALVADDPRAFIAACMALLDQPSTRLEIGRRGPEYIRRHHDWAASAAMLRELLLRL
ncbi:MAG TPA: glycosyltransferase family 4 protein [Candidatus Dormibacteraeota bacterium]|jgi:glycosyltransferase involved in cell wall biosynthesis